MKHHSIFSITLFLLTVIPLLASASEQQTNEFQQMSLVLSTVEAFVYDETREQPGEVIVTPGRVDNRITLPKCHNLIPFTPIGGRLWGNTSVGVRCSSNASWTIYIQVNIKIMADVVHIARPVTQGKPLIVDDIILKKVNLTEMPVGIFTDPSQALGKVPTTTLASGQPLRQHSLRAPHVILRGQKVKLQILGKGFSINSEGHALADASEGQVVQVRNRSGRVISGIAQLNAIVEVQP